MANFADLGHRIHTIMAGCFLNICSAPWRYVSTARVSSAVLIQGLISPWHVSPVGSSLRHIPYSFNTINIFAFITWPSHLSCNINPSTRIL